ncbi:hypothetical protein [Mucilaginibacter pedocola]|uniref:Uncharacterized protein n=1 Tax=Mucilaginibacter pedocola TaxID=1792845 RepID=A0A1S9P832_9SPHI|nr:hypothetical protein [Mucilaginibacter pedocola]OOQ57120.1 hypothetical protein BC343_16500 [Mucilaginibacter pedocola]
MKNTIGISPSLMGMIERQDRLLKMVPKVLVPPSNPIAEHVLKSHARLEKFITGPATAAAKIAGVIPACYITKL